MKHAEIVSLFKNYYAEILDKQKARIDSEGPISAEKASSIENILEELNELIDSDCANVEELLGFNGPVEDGQTYQDIKRFMQRFERSYSVGSKEYKMIENVYKFARRNYYNDLLKYNSQVTNYSLLGGNEAISKDDGLCSETYTLEKLIKAYCDEVKPNVSEKSFKDKDASFKYLKDYLGADYRLNNLSHKEVQSIKKDLQATPTNRNKNIVTKNKPLKEQIALAKAEGLDTFSITNVNKYLGYYSTLFKWGMHNGFVNFNLFENIQIKNNASKNRRLAFSKKEVQDILYELEHNTLGLVKNKSQYWGVLIAIYTGARLNEICSLTVGDVKKDEVSGIWYFNIVDEEEQGKTLKTKAARRTVPVHSGLIARGFLDFLKESKKITKSEPIKDGMKTRLLYDLTYTESRGWGRKLSQFMNNRLLVQLGIHEDNKKTLHSLRHSFITKLVAADVRPETIKSIVGHEQGTVTYDVYTHYGPEHLPQFKEAIEKLSY